MKELMIFNFSLQSITSLRHCEEKRHGNLNIMKNTFLISLVLLTFSLLSQSKSDLIGKWKSYESDSSSFHYLELNKNGSGFKGMGKTINGKDSIYTGDKSFFEIKKWKLLGQSVLITFKEKKFLPVTFEYKLEDSVNRSFKLSGVHYGFGVYPSRLNMQDFEKTIEFKEASTFKNMIGQKTDKCVNQYDLFDFLSLNDSIKYAKYIGFNDLIPHLLGCTQDFQFIKSYNDSAYIINVPDNFNYWSIGYGNHNFYYKFSDTRDTSSETSIVIYYDFEDKKKTHFLKQIEEGKKEKKVVIENKEEIYLFKNWQKKYSGKIFYDNHLSISYFTKDKSKEVLLQRCIASFFYLEVISQNEIKILDKKQ
jgi:hypothetical protein